jgi:RNA polymerase sigma factor for flagellar operon FliA
MPNSPEIDAIWTEYIASRSPTQRDQLIVNYSPLVKYVAGRVAVGLPANVEQADLVSYGVFGLINAIERFEPARGFKFETYAIPRIKGAILDELRSMDWVPRSVRAKARSIERAIAKLEADYGRSPTDEEIAEELEISVDDLHSVLTDISHGGITALDELIGRGERGDSVTLGETLPDASAGPGGQYEVQEMRQIIAGSINRMAEREKIVLTLYYYEGLTLADIGKVLGVTESRVCQIHTKAVLNLRTKVQSLDRSS